MRKNRSNCTRGMELHNLAKSPRRGTGGARAPTPPQKCRFLAMIRPVTIKMGMGRTSLTGKPRDQWQPGSTDNAHTSCPPGGPQRRQMVLQPYFLDYNSTLIYNSINTCIICGGAGDASRFLGAGDGAIHVVVWFYLFGGTREGMQAVPR